MTIERHTPETLAMIGRPIPLPDPNAASLRRTAAQLRAALDHEAEAETRYALAAAQLRREGWHECDGFEKGITHTVGALLAPENGYGGGWALYVGGKILARFPNITSAAVALAAPGVSPNVE
jgi:hypothetical protein